MSHIGQSKQGQASGSVGPRFDRVRVIVLCRHADGHVFLLCSCFLYQRELKLCECVLLVKRTKLKLHEDVHFRHHLTHARTDPSRFPRNSTDGQLDGPGVFGVPTAEPTSALLDLPPGRSGVQAWLREGGIMWIPRSTPVWGGKVSEVMWRNEITRDAMTMIGKYYVHPCTCR